ncbi:GTP-binding and nucleic acid-binding protein YchF [Olavius sp. associated proteobacterium Delta 1]|nr:GTP-binding and nucleic acid-binding protein YchF [Olavius sp. associated proteobacterium Delta 1]
MKLGIIGLPQSGKSTVFEALTKNISETVHKGEDRIGTIRVPDSRIDVLSEMYEPQKTIYAQVEYFLPGTARTKKDQAADQSIWTAARDCDALIQVTRNHAATGLDEKSPQADFRHMEQELILADLVVVEKRLERIEHDHTRGKKMDPEEHALLIDCRKNLENEIPLRRIADLATARKLRGFAFLSAKPLLVLFNNDDDDDRLPEVSDLTESENCLLIRGKLEQELSQMSAQDAAEFLNEFRISESATDRVIRKSYELLGLISFFTVGKDEVRAWTIKKETPAVEAAGAVHSDMQKGFIRAEVLAYEDLMEAGTHAAARKKGTVRLEGKTYAVKDGDLINFRFNV